MVSAEAARYGLCLDFSNTVDWRNGKNAKDSLKEYGDLAKWSREHGILGSREAAQLLEAAKRRGQETVTLKRALELRETIYKIFSAVAHKMEPGRRELDALNGFVSTSMSRSRVVREGRSFHWAWREGGSEPESVLWPIARSAANLLTSDHLAMVGECANEGEGCGWLFLDETKGGNRKWCSMEGCGNRAKARRYYEAHVKGSS